MYGLVLNKGQRIALRIVYVDVNGSRSRIPLRYIQATVYELFEEAAPAWDSAILVFPRGAVAQLGERRVRNAKVVGSIPIGSTNSPSDEPARPWEC